MPFDPAQIELLIGEATPAEARVYVRLPRSAGPAMRLSGHIHGPLCDFARTLPARVPLIDQGQDDPLLAMAVVPDPCFWTPTLPMRYEAIVDGVPRSVDFSPRGQPAGDASPLPAVLSAHILPFGIRPLFRRGKRLLLEGRSWTMRAVAAATAPQAPLDDWRAAGAAMLLADPDEAHCESADRRGVLLVVEVRSSSAPQTIAEVRRLVRHPSVGFVVLPAETQLPVDLRSLAAGALLCQRIDPRAASAMAMRPWADVAIVDASDPPAASAAAAACPTPVIAALPPAPAMEVEQARRLCDVLQADLAGRGEFAGYVV